MRNAEQYTTRNFVITYLLTYSDLVLYGSDINDDMKGCISVMQQGSP
jgi:hypothetical protein